MPSRYSHFYLYAKNHYAGSDEVLSDLRKIASAYCGIPPGNLADAAVAHLLIAAVVEHFEALSQAEALRHVAELLRRIANPIRAQESINPLVAVCAECLRLLAYTTVFGPNGEVLVDLAPADPAILPLNHPAISAAAH